MYGFFKIESAHKTVLAVDLPTRKIVHTLPQRVTDQRPTLFVYIPRYETGLGFLVFDNPNFTSVAFHNRDSGEPIAAVLLNPLSEADMYGLCFPHSRRYLLALPDLDGTGAGLILVHPTEIAAWETFELRSDVGEISPSLRYQTVLITATLAAKRRGVVTALREASTKERPVVAAILAGSLLPAEAECLAQILLNDAEQRREFSELLPGDPWGALGLPELARFMERRRTPVGAEPTRRKNDRKIGRLARFMESRRTTVIAEPIQKPIQGRNYRTIGQELDPIADHDVALGYASVAHQCTAMARRMVPPVKDFCVLTAARNEGLYLLEWIAHHRAIGAEGVFIYTNNNTDGSDALLLALAEAGEITLFQNEVATRPPQFKAYAHALSIAPEVLDYRWCALIDVDEMLGFDTARFSSFPHYIAWQELRAVDAILLNW